MRSADEFIPNQFDQWTLQRNRQIHRTRIKKPRAQTDTKSPQRFSHVGHRTNTNKLEEWRKIEFENKVLLQKMHKIHKNGARSVGGPPAPAPPRSTRPKGAGGNQHFRRKQQDKIARENMQLLKRINEADPEYNTNKLALAERSRVEHLAQLGRFRSKSKFVDSLRDSVGSAPGTARAHSDRRRHSTSYDGVDPARRILSKISAEDMCYVASVTRPPGSVRTVFSALMILVSPFEASGQDLEWPAVREWLETLGGVQPWLSNLWNFNMSLVPVTNALRAEEYLENQTVDEEGLFKFKPAVAHLLKWIHAVCATVGALTQREQSTTGAADEPSAAPQQPQDQEAASNAEQAQDEQNNTGEPESNTGEPEQAEQDSTGEQAQDEQNNIDEPEQAE